MTSGSPTVGIVGAGQLARMMAEAASAIGVRTAVLAARADDAAVDVASEVILGEATDNLALRALSASSDVVTFDHEQVDLGLICDLEHEGVPVRPGVETLRVAVDKGVMRTRLAAAGLPVPGYELLGVAGSPGRAPSELLASIDAFASQQGWPVVVKAARGGYDGKGVWPVAGSPAALALCEDAAAASTPLLLETHVDIDFELAVVVARGRDGSSVAWPPVETAQIRGVCREVRYPGRLDPELADAAGALALEVARVVGATGVLAVELFASRGRLLVNEIAARPHNSAHWTIEGATTSQFENHVRAVLGLPLGDTSPVAPHVASVNVFGPPSGETADPATRLVDALAVRGAHVHLYGKEPRPGRKLGHVTVCGGDPVDVRSRAWAAARALGSPVPDDIYVGTS
ncbi:MAG TPA: 5-(carboxyamino)imidazole ribonucleotide synthase [Acidimicrobiales bacterium]|nr:5-(carboxyamino)imidazole ribonucleotide synthase [Acidimicrobiales bacterium]